MSFDLVDHQNRLAMALLDTEINGVRVDLDLCTQFGVDLQAEIAERSQIARDSAEAEIRMIELEQWKKEINKFKSTGKRQSIPCPAFNWDSSQQLSSLLYEKLKLPGKKGKATKTGERNWITKREYLEEIAHKHPVVEQIVELNRLSTYYGTFIKGVLDRAIGDRIYPEFRVNGTDTGRISHVNPNMGNMPARHPTWNKIRTMFLPDEGETIAKADYSQLEVCIAAHYTRDKNLLRIVYEGISQHDITAEGLGVKRDIAKVINFAMQYGATEHKIKVILDCSIDDAKLALNKYWETYSGMKAKIDEVHALVGSGEDIVSMFGRRRRFPTYVKNPYLLSKMRRQAWSFLVQGTGGDFMNMAFYETVEELKRRRLGRGGWTVHDEGIIFPKKEHDEEAYQLLSSTMVGVAPRMGLTVPLKVEGESGLERWKK